MADLPLIKLSIETTQPFIGTYQRIQIDFGSSDLTLDLITFTITSSPPDAGGSISLAQDDLSTPNEVMLLVGYRPGKHVLQVLSLTGTILGHLDYEIVSSWSEKDTRPPHWVVGELRDFVTGYTWGGGSSAPQNIDVIPQIGTRNICVLMVDTSSSRYPAGSDFDAIKKTWTDATVDIVPGADGKVRSAKAYFEEVSQNRFTLGLAGGQAIEVSLAEDWDSYFAKMSSAFPSNSYGPRGALAQACISLAADLTDASGNALVDFKTVQTLILVIRSAGPAATDNFFWPQAWGDTFAVPGGSANIAVLGMPDAWSTFMPSKDLLGTLCHEIGHNLGFPDLYTSLNTDFSPEIKSRNITNFDLMSREAHLPHMTVGQKMETGWLRPEWVRTFDFSRSTIPVDEFVTLQAAELGAPPIGSDQFSAVEIRLADGWNYYFEYRKGQVSQIGDQALASELDTGDAVIVGTDMISHNFSYPIARPQVMRLRKDAEMENSFFTIGEDYKETDTSSMAISDFKMTVTSISGNTSQFRIQYGINGRPDLYIRPWPAGNTYQSPDILITNDKSLSDPAQWSNQPWIGHANTVQATYRNRGPVTALNVRVDFFIVDFTAGGNSQKVLLGSDTRDVPPETSTTPSVTFETTWIPNNDGHKCIIASTPLYIGDSVTPTIVEITDSNNIAQSNYAKYIARSASPSKREILHVSLTNPFKFRAEIYVLPQIHGLFARFYRLYLSTSSMMLDPGETRKVQVMVESMFGSRSEELKEIIDKRGKEFFNNPTQMSIRGYGFPPEDPVRPVLLGGCQIDVGSGKGTVFKDFRWLKSKNQIRGQVVAMDGSVNVHGMVLLKFHAEKEQVGTSVTVPLSGEGTFSVGDIEGRAKIFRAKRVSAHYLGQLGLAPCEAEKVVDVSL
ncbi:hypothetical protein DL98DRAFT_566682 [Cadophora sp. DSE1049]|nr:hypothetical protein DL98DRAFT_566682 [Cadophora sp. DSE1049]